MADQRRDPETDATGLTSDAAAGELRSAGRAVHELEAEMADLRARLERARERRRTAVVAARAAGASYQSIGGDLGVSPQRARAIASDVVFAARRAAASGARR